MTTTECPVCADGSACRGYPVLWARLRSGRHFEHSFLIHEQLNGRAETPPPPAPEDMALRRRLVRHGCCG